MIAGSEGVSKGAWAVVRSEPESSNFGAGRFWGGADHSGWL